MAVTRILTKFLVIKPSIVNCSLIISKQSFSVLSKCACDSYWTQASRPKDATLRSSNSLGKHPRNQFHTSKSLLGKDYYDILGIPRNASPQEVKKAYYQLAKKYHPDQNKTDPNASKKFQEVSEAYEVLSDDTKRKQYDSWGQTSEEMDRQGRSSPGSQGPGRQGSYQTYGEWQFHSSIDPEELFRKIFGDRGPFSVSEEDFSRSHFGFGPAQEIILKLSFVQAARGCTREVKVNVVDPCPRCKGSKCELGYKPMMCPYCDGTGTVTMSKGPFVIRQTCGHCQGSRVFIGLKCVECAGKGKVVAKRIVKIPVPPGVADGQTVRMSVNDNELFITFKVDPSAYFRREGANVFTDAEISISQAVLGGTIRIEGIYEDHTIFIKPGTSSHQSIILPNKGLKKIDAIGYGDHTVQIKIKAPGSLTEKQKALIQAYAELEEDTPGHVQGVDATKGKEEKSMAGEDKESKSLLQRIKNSLFG
ncbi:unnamed protein product [Bemisia tabaci]|uniref:Uncharacterized protein n=1 Tax=Bemisia tabaci TaxID=7038 RepID=A0A9P0A3C9_BEMTA|nr:unnamed protein product [Bemisia tabaci]